MSKICYIVGAGEDVGIDFVRQAEDLVIAADGGYEKLQHAGIKPDLVIGDFDSLGHVPQFPNVVTLPVKKDVTDTWAAVELAMERGYKVFHLYGCTGGRVEHTLANIQMAASLAQRGMQCFIFGSTQVITAVHNASVDFSPDCTGYFSLFSYSERCQDVTLQGFLYELSRAELNNGYPLGVSNEFTGCRAVLAVGCGTAILVYDRKNCKHIHFH